MITPTMTLEDILTARLPDLSRTEARVARLFLDHREEVLLASAASLAAMAGTSDASVIRTAKALGFHSMEALRRAIAAEVKRDLSQADRLSATLGEIGGDLARAFVTILDGHTEAIAGLRREISAGLFEKATRFIAEAPHLVVFGIGPSHCIAEYLSLQLGRFGLATTTLSDTGLLAADALGRLRPGDRLVVLAYGRIYPEVAVLLEEAERLELGRILLTDTLASALRPRFDLVLPVARGRTGMLSLHTATLALIEALLVGVATLRPDQTHSSLVALNTLRARLAGRPMDLPADLTKP